MDSSLSSLLGQALAQAPGLTHVHLPDGISRSMAVDIVVAANSFSPSTPQFAFLLSSEPVPNTVANCPVVSAKESIRYRQGNHLAVVVGRQPDLSSFIQVFRQIFGQSYPDAAAGLVALERLANLAVQRLYRLVQVTPSNDEFVASTTVVQSCLHLLQRIHMAEADNIRTWNSAWFDHADLGLINIGNVLNRLREEGTPLSLRKFLEKYAHACFGLPRPASAKGNLVQKPAAGATLNAALQDYWSDSEKFGTTSRRLDTPEGLPDAQEHPLALLDPIGLNESISEKNDAWLGLTSFIGENKDFLHAYSHLTDDEFTDPGGLRKKNQRLALFDANGLSMTADDAGPESPFLIPLPSGGLEQRRTVTSDMLELRVPLEIPDHLNDVQLGDTSMITVNVSPAGTFSWTLSHFKLNKNSISLYGRINRKMGSGSNAIPYKGGSLSVEVAPSSNIAAFVSPQLFSQFHSFQNISPYLVVAACGAKGKIFSPKYLGPLENQDGTIEFAEELKSQIRGYLIMVWNPDTQSQTELDGTPLSSSLFSPHLYLSPFTPSGDSEIIAGDSIFRLRPVAAGEGQQSALLAAALKQQVQPNRPGPETENSVRGRAEQYFGTLLSQNSADLFSALGHVVMPTDWQSDFDDLRPQDDGTILMATQARHALARQGYISFEHNEFTKGAEATRLREALKSLNLEKMMSRSDHGSGPKFEWPSRTSFRSLWETEQLEEYLSAYVALIKAARQTGEDELVFWASYPMSISIWDVTTSHGCQGVLLSPLHPLRLAWLAGVESTLFEATNAVSLMGSIEGWNLPLTGPGESSSRKMIAVPSDSGDGQLFLGWSMLVPAGSSEARQISSPRLIGTMTAPGTAISGLNSMAVNSAMRSFRKMHPHVSTLTIDLHSSKIQGRIQEIDSAILRIAEEWGGSGTDGLPGGLRVYDSALREGHVPRDEVTRIVRNNKDLLLTWSRYSPDPQANQTCNIRFLQSTGTAIRVSDGESRTGAIGHIPLRRFATSSGTPDRRRLSTSEPGIELDMGWRPYTRALAAIESSAGGPKIQAGMQKTDIDDVTSDWTVFGESFLSPAVMAELMDGESTGSRMLWEWRPPVFEKKIGAGVPLIEKRPFISVARVPSSFGDQLSQLLIKATDGNSDDSLKKTVMSTLGSRGVGLSSLISMGGTHVAGALGFYLSLALLDRVSDDNTNRLVMPIDAADYFLRVLADESEHGRDLRRADLLYIELSDDEILISPVEIKSYGLKAATETTTRLPKPGSAALDESLEQLKASYELLKKIEKQSTTVMGSDAVLWRNSLATLIETASRLSPNTMGNEKQLAQRISRVLAGHVRVAAGRPMLNYFQHGLSDTGNDQYYIGAVGTPDFNAEGLIARTGAVFAALNEDDSQLVSDWSKFIISPTPELHLDAIKTECLPPRIDFPSGTPPKSHVPDATSVADNSRTDLQPDLGASTTDHSTILNGQSHNLQDQSILHDGIRLTVGRVIDSLGSAPVDFWPSNTQLNQLNIGIVGDLGTGKTELIKSLVSGIRKQALDVQSSVPASMLVLDYKGDFQGKEFLEDVGGIVLQPHNIPINIFLPETGEYSRKPYQQAAAFVDTLTRIYSGVGPVQARNLNSAIRELFAENQGHPPTLAAVHARYESMIAGSDSVLSILDSFVYGEIFSSNSESLIPFSNLLDGKVVVVALDKLGQDQRAKNALVAFFLNIYYDHMLRSGTMDFQGSEPQLRFVRSYLLVDEAVNIMRYDFEVLMNLMLQGRQFGVGIMLASQYLSHFREGKVNHGQPLRTWFIHKVPSVSLRELEALGMPGLQENVVKRIPDLGLHEVLYKSFGWDDGWFVRVTPYYEL
ncbi:ATP-binding protein [Arthrobacter sp. Sr24]